MLSDNIIRLFLSLVAAVMPLGCSLVTTEKPSIMVIAVDSLGFGSFSCSNPVGVLENLNSGLQQLCSESVRFTHAYTPSVLTQATLASILTAQYPYVVGVHHNGSDFLSAKFETIAEVAQSKGYQTSFFSGGPPIWSKSGFGQGFEVFDDHYNIQPNHLYRSAKENFDLFLDWIDGVPSSKPFFNMMYLADLQFIEQDTVTKLGIVRERSYHSQVEAIDEALGDLIHKMKKKKIWDNTYVVLVGLNGTVGDKHVGELRGFNLYSENTQVALMVKPARKQRDLGLQWKEDRNVSLVDLGATLFDLIKAQIPIQPNPDIKVISLAESLKLNKATFDSDRLILMESGWSMWHGFGNIRYALRKGNYLFLHDSEPKFYNSVSDKFELVQLASSDPAVKWFADEVKNFLDQVKLEPWSGIKRDILNKYEKAIQVLGKRDFNNEQYQILKQLSESNPKDKQVLGWRAWRALKKEDWRELQKIARESNNEVLDYVAGLNLNLNLGQPKNDCLNLLNVNIENQIIRKKCDDTIFLAFVDWIQAVQVGSAEVHLEKFLRSYYYENMDQKIGELNYRAGLTWAVDIQKPYPPSVVDLSLYLPKFRKETLMVQRRLDAEFENLSSESQ